MGDVLVRAPAGGLPHGRLVRSIRVPLCAYLLLAAWHSSSASPLVSSRFLAFDVGTTPRSVAIVNLNGDAQPDLTIANLGSSSISVLFGNPDGTFRPGTIVPTGNSPNALASADFNDDGQADLAVPSSGDSLVSVFLGNGDGTFRARADFATGRYPRAIAIGDLNADGLPDLATANTASHTISVLLGNGDGTFQPRMDFGTGRNPVSLAIGDVNGDAQPDLVSANFGNLVSGSISVLLGNGDGTFRTGIETVVGSGANSVALADLDRDGHLDVAVGYNCAGEHIYPTSISILVGNGDGTFGTRTDLFTGPCPWVVAIADLNGDAKLDVATANGDSVIVFAGDGTGGFGARTAYVTGLGSGFIAVGDLNHDGRADLVFPDQVADTVSILFANEDGTFGQKIPSLPTNGSQFSLAVADFDLNGSPDIAVPSDQPVMVSVWPSLGDGTFGSRRDTPIPAAAGRIAAGDLDRDGRPDLALTSSDQAVSTLLGNGDGTFRPGMRIPTGCGCGAIAIADLNNDPWPDVVVGMGSVGVFLGDGGGGLRPRQDYATGCSGPVSVAIGDLNGDGSPDLAEACSGYASGGTVSVLLGNGDGTFGPSTEYSAGIEPMSVAVGDLNQDGRLDLAVANAFFNYHDGRVSVLLGNGDGSFAPPIEYRSGYHPRSIAIADLNRDSKLDIAVATSGESNTVSLLLGRGDGTFSPKVEFGVGGDLVFLTTGDFRTDGWPDLAVLSNWSPLMVSVLINQGAIATSAQPSQTRLRGTFLHRPAELWPGGPIRVGYTIAQQASLVRLAIYDALGRLVRVLDDGSREPGEHQAIWDPRDPSGPKVARGVYFVRLNAGGVTDSGKVLLLFH